MKKIILTGEALTLSELKTFLTEKVQVEIAPSVTKKLYDVRKFVEEKAASNVAHYGINTGFGRLASKKIPQHELELLQRNIILSHAVGVGEPMPLELSRLMMLLRAHVLAQGYSGICAETLQLLVALLNHDITPVIPCQGSVGASGDLAPLAHIGLTLIGEGEVFFQGKKVAASKALQTAALQPITLKAKEGLALVNGTQAILAYAVAAVLKAENLLKSSDVIGALAVEGDLASISPFDERIHQLRPHPGQIATAKNIRTLLANSEIVAGHVNCHRVQDPYSFRCIPQVHGACKDAYRYVRQVVECELASCTDNPLLFPEDDAILSGGNFHGEPVAMAMDMLAIALAELASISERRVAILIAPLDQELPTSFLVPNSGLNSGMMIPHVVMSALVSENKTLCHPASVDSIPTSGGQEDHVSMGTWAARKALQVAQNVEKVLGIELLCAAQAIDMHPEQHHAGKGTKPVYQAVRNVAPAITGDRAFYVDMSNCIDLLVSGAVVKTAETALGQALEL